MIQSTFAFSTKSTMLVRDLLTSLSDRQRGQFTSQGTFIRNLIFIAHLQDLIEKQLVPLVPEWLTLKSLP